MNPTEAGSSAQQDSNAIRDQRLAQSRIDFTRATELTPDVLKQIEDAFTYHPWDPQKIKSGELVREHLARAVAAIIENVPPGPDRSAAIRKIREARMDANSAITHGGRY